MEQSNQGTVAEVLYEIRHHARGSTSPDSSREKIGRGSKGGLLSYLSLRGINQLKEKWDGYKQPRALKRVFSLFVSNGGEHVAVAAGNQIIILQKEDDYMEPCGIFVSAGSLTTFTNGTWLEPQGILGVIDDASTLYFIKSNGEEITRKSRSQLKLKAPIRDLIVPDDLNLNRSGLIGCFIFTADGLRYRVEVTQEPSACIYPVQVSSNPLTKGQFPHNLSCLDFHQDLSLVIVVAPLSVSENYTALGSYSLYLLHITKNLELELLYCSSHFGGLFAPPKEHKAPLVSPKVAMSMKGKYVATLDLTGCVDVFVLDVEQHSLSLLASARSHSVDTSDNLGLGQKYLTDVIDISWWDDHVLVFAKQNGIISMYNFHNGNEVSVSDHVFSMPIINRVKCREGSMFLLESTSSGKRFSVLDHEEKFNKLDNQLVNYENYNKLDDGSCISCWNLMSFSCRSVSEMYAILISNKKYQASLDFASHHELDRDEVFKAQWLHSDQGTREINMFLSKIKDQAFILAECVNKVGPTEDIVKALLSYGLQVTDQYRFSNSKNTDCTTVWDIRMVRLQLLQYKDRLETFVGINMGRFQAQEFAKFRVLHLIEAATSLAESGKIGALNLLFKRHPFSLSRGLLGILSSIPETVPVQTYGQLVPGRSPPSTFALRDADWVECEKMVTYINNLTGRSEVVLTENILKLSVGLVWPSVDELSEWYKKRALDIDNLSGQLDNSLYLVEYACRKGIVEVQQFFATISYLHQLIYSDEDDEDFSLSLVAWQQLSDYEKFKMMLKGIKEDKVVDRLREKAIPFMQSQLYVRISDSELQMKEEQLLEHNKQKDSFVVGWLKEVALENKLEICLAVIENGCGDQPIEGLFKHEAELMETGLQCIYACTLTDHWDLMASILSKLSCRTLREKSTKGSKEFNQKQVDQLENQIKIAEGHVEVGRLLAYYQVPKPISFFLDAQSDERNVKQLIRLVLSKFGRRQPGRSDHDWANMWRDMQCFQEKAFPFLDLEYMLIEFIRGLLKAGKFSLARNYLKGTSTIVLATEKAENLVIQAAREYFFSASSISCIEIWKAKDCLSLFPNSKNVQAEADLIDALTVRLPNLGVTLLPVQFKQIRDPMEIINMVITSQTGVYLNVEELIEIAKLLGLRSPGDIATVEAAIAREAAVAGDLQLAFDLCLVLAKKCHGSVWDLCAAIARGPDLDNMNSSSRKKLLGFALTHCDEDSVGELLNAWKDVDMRSQYEQLMDSTGTCPPNFLIQGSSIISLPIHSVQDVFDLRATHKFIKSSIYESQFDNQTNFQQINAILSEVGKNLCAEDGISWDTQLRENRKLIAFAALELPWLQELSKNEEYGKKAIASSKVPSGNHFICIRTQAVVTILYWLAGNDIAPHDDLIASLAYSVMEPPVTKEEDVLGCSFLLNLVDAFRGAAILEEQLKRREVYQELCSIMNMGMSYSTLYNSCLECSSPDQRRELLLHKFQVKHASFRSDERNQLDQVQSTFWREWKLKLEEQKQLAEQARALEQLIPGVETARFLSGDIKYIESVIFSFIDTVKLEKNHILKDAVMLADSYGLHRTEVLVRFFGNALVSEYWENDDILAEISEFREDIVTCAKEIIDMISSVVYPEIEGHNKQRLSYIYSILSACFLRLKRRKDPALAAYLDKGHGYTVEAFQFYKILEQECKRVSFITELNFKNIAGFSDLNFEHFNEETFSNIHESTVEALADMVQTLIGIYDFSKSKGLISWQDVYKHHIMGLLMSLERENVVTSDCISPAELHSFIRKADMNYKSCKKDISKLSDVDAVNIVWRYCTVCIPHCILGRLENDSAWKDCLIMLLNLWVKMIDEIMEILNDEASHGEQAYSSEKYLSRCLEVFKRLVIEDKVSASQGWSTVASYANLSPQFGLNVDISGFCQAMIFSGSEFQSVAEIYYEAELKSACLGSDNEQMQLVDLYINLVNGILLHLSKGVSEQQNLHFLLSSLSRFNGKHIDDLRMIRHEVWERLSAFSNNMQLESRIRVYALELMQSVGGKNLRSLPLELVAEVKPWEAWDDSYGKDASIHAPQGDTPSSITSNLVALRSTQLVATISPTIKILAEDLLTLDSAVSCFLHISEVSTSLEDLNVLQAVLEEWEELFSCKTEKETAGEPFEEFNNWSNDDWDEGWEDLPEEPIKTEEKQQGSVCVQPLHKCWMELIKRFIGFSRVDAVVELLDQSLVKKDGVLLDEDDANCLSHLLAGIDCFVALKALLLLPYNGPRAQCLHILEAKLKNESISISSTGDDNEVLMLVLFSGVLRDVATNPAFSKVFACICYSVGRLARLCQEDLLRCRSDGSTQNLSRSLLFSQVLFPCFIAELVKTGQCLLAGLFVSQWMHTPASLGLINVVEAILRRYLESHTLQSQPADGSQSSLKEMDSCSSLVHTVTSLREKLGIMVQSALSSLPADVK